MPGVVLATGGLDHTVRFWQAPSGVPYRTIQFAESQVNSLSIGPQKQLIMVAGNPLVRFFDVNSNNNNSLINLEGHTNNVVAGGFHREERWVYTGSEDQTLRIWDLRTHRSSREFNNGAPVTTACLHPNQGEIVFGDHTGRVRIWELGMNLCRQEVIPTPTSPIRSISIPPDGSMLAVSNNKGMVYSWAPPRPTEASLNLVPESQSHWNAHDGRILKCLFAPDGRYLATCASDSLIKLWTPSTEPGGPFELHKTLAGHSEWVWDCVFSADSAYLVSAASDHVARLWDLTSGETIRHYTGHHKAIVTVALNDSP